MGSFSGWHWLVVLVLIAGFAVPILAIVSERSDRTIGRMVLLRWVAVVVIVPATIRIVAAAMGYAAGGIGASYLVVLCLCWPLYRAAVQRARDVGWGKMLPALAIIPVLNLVVFVILLVTPGRDTADSGLSST